MNGPNSRYSFIIAIVSSALLLSNTIFLHAATGTARDYTAYVDTRMGTDSRPELSHGNTYPGTGRPFGLHLWSPQTGVNGSGWKYTWKAEAIKGFTLSHQCSPWSNDYGCLSLFPQTGDSLQYSSHARKATFRHRDETALPHYYSVTFRNGIRTEMAPTDRCCCFRFTFPDNGEKATLLFDLTGRKGEITAEKNIIKGYILIGGPRGRELKNHFIIKCDEPFTDFTLWEENRENGAVITFHSGKQVELKIGTSYISYEQAELNLKREIGKGHFDQVKEEGRRVWNALLGRIEVSGGREEDMKTFYTCLYRANQNSRMFYELDGNGEPVYFSPHDFRLHKGYMYNDNGLWDAYHSQFPLFNILHPARQERLISSMMDVYDQTGWLPSWSQPFDYGGMTGNHAISVLADAWAKGIRPVEPGRILEAYIHEITHNSPRGMSKGRPGHEEYREKGYVPYPEYNHGSTLTLEYAYNDWCGMLFAREAGDTIWENRLRKSSQNYRNVFSEEVGFMRGRDSEGNWTPDFRPGAWGGPFEEGNSWQYSFLVPHDVPGMISLYGGEEAFCDKLDALFTTPPLIDFGFYPDVWNEMVEMVIADMGMFNQGNQPCHHIPYLYVYAGRSRKTQTIVRRIMTELYSCTPKGYPGDDDQGSMSSWFVLSALGIYSVCPGTTEYAIGSPLFEQATVHLENGRDFTVIAEGNNEDNVHIRSLSLNGQPMEGYFLDHSQIMAGGTLTLEMEE